MNSRFRTLVSLDSRYLLFHGEVHPWKPTNWYQLWREVHITISMKFKYLCPPISMWMSILCPYLIVEYCAPIISLWILPDEKNISMMAISSSPFNIRINLFKIRINWFKIRITLFKIMINWFKIRINLFNIRINLFKIRINLFKIKINLFNIGVNLFKILGSLLTHVVHHLRPPRT